MSGDGTPGGSTSSSPRHDLINALNAVRGYAELLVGDLPEGRTLDWSRRILVAAEQAMAVAQTLPRTPMAAPAPAAGSVLMVAPAALSSLAGGLERLGWTVAHALNAREARQVLRDMPGAWTALLVDAALGDAAAVEGLGRAAGIRTVRTGLSGMDPAALAAALAVPAS